jgi:hypothetical protein
MEWFLKGSPEDCGGGFAIGKPVSKHLWQVVISGLIPENFILSFIHEKNHRRSGSWIARDILRPFHSTDTDSAGTC